MIPDTCSYPSCRAESTVGLLGAGLCDRHWQQYAALHDLDRVDKFRERIGAPKTIRLKCLPQNVKILPGGLDKTTKVDDSGL